MLYGCFEMKLSLHAKFTQKPTSTESKRGENVTLMGTNPIANAAKKFTQNSTEIQDH